MPEPSPEPVPDWPRPHYQGPGGKPFLFYVVYGVFGEMPALSAGKYRCAGVPEGFELSEYDVQDHPEVVARFQEGDVWKWLQADDPDLAQQVAAAPACMILRGEIEDSATLNYLRDAVGLATFFLDHGGVAVYDPFLLKWWRPDEWREQLFAPAGPVPLDHVAILASEESDVELTWLHTRGLRKFGRPELSIHNVPPKHRDAIIDLCERFIEFQALGAVIPEGQEIKMQSLPQGMTCHHAGDLDDPDFNNVHIEISWLHERN